MKKRIMNVGDEDTKLINTWGILILSTQNRIKFKQMYSFNLPPGIIPDTSKLSKKASGLEA